MKERQHAIGEEIVGGDLEGAFERTRGVGLAAIGPVEVRQSEMGSGRLRIGLDGLPERSFRIRLSPRGLLEGPEADVAERVVRIEPDGFLNFFDGAIDIPQAGEGVAEQDLRIHVAAIEREGIVGARRRVLELTREQQHAARLQLRLDVLRQQVRRADVLAGRSRPVSILNIGLGEAEARFAETRILLEGVAILNNRFADLLLAHEPIAALACTRAWRPRGRAYRRR